MSLSRQEREIAAARADTWPGGVAWIEGADYETIRDVVLDLTARPERAEAG